MEGDPLRQLVRTAIERVFAREREAAAASGAPAARAPGCAAQAAPAATAPEPRPAGYLARRGDVVIASDHGGFELKEVLVRHLKDLGYRVRDLGTHSTEAVDYPDFALQVAAAVAQGKAWRGIVVDGVGVGSAIAANKVPGIRAATCFDIFSTRNSREHNDANVLSLGGRVLEPKKACEMARIFLETEFGGDRHARRVQKIVDIERLFLGAAQREPAGGGAR